MRDYLETEFDRGWIVAGGAVALFTLVEGFTTLLPGEPFGSYLAVLVLAVLTGAAVALADSRPGVALAVAWSSYPVWLAASLPVLLSQLALLAVAFSCGRRGGRAVILAAALSCLAAPPLLIFTGFYMVPGALGTILGPVGRFVDGNVRADLFGGFLGTMLVLLLLGTVLLLSPLLAGLSVRLWERSKGSEEGRRRAERQREESRQEAETAYADAETARELAALQESHAELARDVHDVVGHSLTVVIAQAEAAQYAGDDPETLRGTLRTIAETARMSLADVRRVLAQTGGAGPAASVSAGGADDPLPGLVEGLRRGGHTVHVHEEGSPRPLPPELATVAHRVMQEMLTNAARHGDSSAPVEVERHWDGDELRVDVRNALPVLDRQTGEPADPEETRPLTPLAGGRGIDGMRERLTAVGGRLDVRRRAGRDPDAGSFTATAWIPLRPTARRSERSEGW